MDRISGSRPSGLRSGYAPAAGMAGVALRSGSGERKISPYDGFLFLSALHPANSESGSLAAEEQLEGTAVSASGLVRSG